MAGYEKAVKKDLKSSGYEPERNPRGSHVIWSNADVEVSVPTKIGSRHTANAILKEGGINKKL